MREVEIRFVYLFVFFDLPVKTREERRNATRFRKFLINDGYDMMQLSVYTRVCHGQDAADKHFGRGEKNLPPEGERPGTAGDGTSIRTHEIAGRNDAAPGTNGDRPACSALIGPRFLPIFQRLMPFAAYIRGIGRETKIREWRRDLRLEAVPTAPECYDRRVPRQSKGFLTFSTVC